VVASSKFEVHALAMDSPITAKAALLQALIEGESYGLELIDRVETRTRGKLKLGQGSVYPALRDLEKEGLVESYEADPLPERGGRPRRYYKITATGRRAAREDGQVVAALFGALVPT
jgi:PadR family transcriptional regulator PadR